MEIQPSNEYLQLITTTQLEHDVLINAVQHQLVEAASDTYAIEPQKARSLARFLQVTSSEPINYGVFPDNMPAYSESLRSHARSLDGAQLETAIEMATKIDLYKGAADDLLRPIDSEVPDSWFQ